MDSTHDSQCRPTTAHKTQRSKAAVVNITGFETRPGTAGQVQPGKGKGQEILTLPNLYPYERVGRVV